MYIFLHTGLPPGRETSGRLFAEVEQVVVEPVDHVMEVHSEAVKEEKRPRSFMEQDIEQVKLSGHLQRSLLLAYFC